MSFTKKVISVAILTSVMASASAFAANEVAKKGATVTFKAQLRDAACDVTSTTEGDTVDFGTFTVDTLSQVAADSQIGPTKEFSLLLNNCSKAANPAAVFIYADGSASTHTPEYFANKAAQFLAVNIFSGADAATGTTIVPNKATQLSDITEIAADSSISVPLKANLMLTQAGSAAKPEVMNVPVTFSVSYN